MTETPEIAAALDVAEARWPDVPRGQLIPRMLRDWAAHEPSGSERRHARRRLAGSLAGGAGGYDKNAEWPI